jgi:hypothetical protein
MGYYADRAERVQGIQRVDEPRHVVFGHRTTNVKVVGVSVEPCRLAAAPPTMT